MKNLTTLLTPIRIILLYLLFMAVAATTSWGGDIIYFELSFMRLTLIYLGMVGSFFVLSRFGVRDSIRWEHRVITSLILYLLFDPLQPFWVFLLAGALAEIVSRLLRSLTGPVFNPTASAALILSIFGILPGWWGVSFAPRIPLIQGGISFAALITLLVAGYVASTYKKLPILMTIIPSFFVGTLLLFNINLAVFLTLEGTALFYWLVMAVEPKTSPMMFREQLIFGLVVGLVGAVLMKLNFLDPYVGALVIGNLTYFVMGMYARKIRLINPIQPKVALASTSL